MHESKRQRLEAKGWKVGKVQEFLGLSEQEAHYLEIKLKLAEVLRRKRREKHLGQTQVAALVGSSQSRVAKMEAGDDSVSIDLLIRSLIALGASDSELGRAISKAGRSRELVAST